MAALRVTLELQPVKMYTILAAVRCIRKDALYFSDKRLAKNSHGILRQLHSDCINFGPTARCIVGRDVLLRNSWGV